MYQHLGIEINKGIPSTPNTPPSTQNTTASGSGSNAHPSSSTRPAPSSTRAPTAPRPPTQTGPSQPPAAQITQLEQSVPQQAHPSSAHAAQPAAPNLAPLAAQPAAVSPTAAQPQAIPAPTDEIATLRAQIAELEHGNAHSNHLLARAPVPQQALVADPADIDRIWANLAGAKEEPKWLILPALQPGHKYQSFWPYHMHISIYH
ncbi:hypothetical protein BDR03DRAFT_1010977 [Suillus americanus]|nr:hypothetical protein BDR03DRAFT_1010977 [Suillus americanus]